LVKTFAVGAVMVAAALPAMALTGTASAATTAPTIVCTNATTAASPTCSTGYAIVGQGFAGNFVAEGSSFAFDQAIGGAVTLTTTAPGVTFTNVAETSATVLTADVSTTSATTPGFYPVTLTDDNGTTTFAVGLGVDNGPQVATVAGNAGTVGGANSTVSVTGTFLNNSTVSIEPVALATAPTIVGAPTLSNSGTTLSFTVAQATGTTPGAYTVLITSTWPTGALGSTTTSYTVNGAPTVVSITGVTPNELGIPVTNPSSQTVTISGTGFELGAILTVTPVPADPGVTITDPTFVNSTTMTALVTVAPGAVVSELTVAVVNPDTSHVSGAGLIGVGEPPTNTTAGPAAPVAPALGAVSGFLAPGTASVIQVSGTSTFPITTGSTVKVAQGGAVTNPSETLTGSVTAVAAATNTATILVKVPRYATSTTTAAVTAAATSLTVADATGIASPTVATIVDGASTEQVTGTLAGNVLTITSAGGTRFAHAAGVTVEFPFPATVAGVTNTLSINNGTNTETSTPVLIEEGTPTNPVTAYPFHNYSAAGTGANLTTLDPGSYSITAYLPGFGFTTGAAVSFQSFTAGGVADVDGVTGTVAVVNGNVATLSVSVPKTRSGDTGDHLTVGASPGQNAITLNSVVNSSVAGPPNILVGDSITIEPDAFYLTPETVTVTSVNATTDVVGITPALADNHTGGAAGVGAEIIDNSDPQSINDRVQATILNGSGGVEVDPTFFSFSTGGSITSTTLATANATAGDPGVAPFGTVNSVGAGAKGATVNLLLSQATDGSAPADWTGSSTNPAVTFGPITNDTGTNITTTINVAPGTPATASVPISFTDGLETYAGTIAIVAGPTISAVTAVGNLTAGSAGFTVGVTGTNFVVGSGAVNSTADANMICTTSDPAVVCHTLIEPTDTTTTATVEILPGPTMLNGTDSITLTDAGDFAVGAGPANVPNYGAATLAGAFTVSGQPTVTAISPTVVPFGTDPTLTATGTLFATSGTDVCTDVETTPLGVATAGPGCTATQVSATSATITAYGTVIPAGDTVVFTFGTATSEASTPAVTVQADPVTTYIVTSSVLSNFYKTNGVGGAAAEDVAAGSTAVPFHIVGTGFLAAATVTLASTTAGGTAGTAAVTSVTPNGIFGTLTIPVGATLGGESATVTNANGGATTFADLFTITAAPTIVTPAAAAPKAILDGVAATITITGSGFVTGAVVTGAVTGVDTFGTAVVSNSANPADKCTGFTSPAGSALDTCNTITVPITPVSYSGSTPILDGLVVTNPLGGGSVTVQNDITVNPVPAVTGTYYVPTFTSNREITINGTGFESGITASSANPDYTVLAVASTPTTVTLLVTTDSNATSGTSSTITLTNPDGGSGTFPLNGGPNPNTVTPTPHAVRTVGVVHTGKTSIVKVVGTHFYGQPTITSNDKGTKVRTTGDTGKILTLKVTTAKTTKHGVHTFIIRFANGEQTNVKYNDTK
jgi:hypothetical protein